jgi:hypothetical protein
MLRKALIIAVAVSVGCVSQCDGSDEEPSHDAQAHDGHVRGGPDQNEMRVRF